jgi:hypothetical protein
MIDRLRGAFRREIEADVEIDAAPERVWSVLTDVSAYGSWNRFMPRIVGDLEEGCRIDVRACPRRSPTLRFHATVLEVAPTRRLRWRGRLGIAGLFDGDHRFTVERLAPERTRLSQREELSGLLVPLLGPFIAGRSLAGFREMNLALKRRAEEKEGAP